MSREPVDTAHTAWHGGLRLTVPTGGGSMDWLANTALSPSNISESAAFRLVREPEAGGRPLWGGDGWLAFLSPQAATGPAGAGLSREGQL